jgi:hypothetical protein
MSLEHAILTSIPALSGYDLKKVFDTSAALGPPTSQIYRTLAHADQAGGGKLRAAKTALIARYRSPTRAPSCAAADAAAAELHRTAI